MLDGGLYVEPSAYNAYAKMEEELNNDEKAIELYVDLLEEFPGHLPSIMVSCRCTHLRKLV